MNEEKQEEYEREQNILSEQAKLHNEKLIKLSGDNKANITTSLATVTAVENEIQCICSVFEEAFELLRDSNINLSITFNTLSKKKILKNFCVSDSTETVNTVTEKIITDKNENGEIANDGYGGNQNEGMEKEDDNNQVAKLLLLILLCTVIFYKFIFLSISSCPLICMH